MRRFSCGIIASALVLCGLDAKATNPPLALQSKELPIPVLLAARLPAIGCSGPQAVACSAASLALSWMAVQNHSLWGTHSSLLDLLLTESDLQSEGRALRQLLDVSDKGSQIRPAMMVVLSALPTPHIYQIADFSNISECTVELADLSSRRGGTEDDINMDRLAHPLISASPTTPATIHPTGRSPDPAFAWCGRESQSLGRECFCTNDGAALVGRVATQ